MASQAFAQVSALPAHTFFASPVGSTGFFDPRLMDITDIPALATNTVMGNATSGSAPPTALAMPSCSAAGSVLQWTTNTGFGSCHTLATSDLPLFLQSGSGAVAYSYSNWVKTNAIRPQDYGAACDNATDDATAIAAWATALATIPRGEVHGKCLTSSRVTFPAIDNLSVSGDGSGSSMLIYTGGGTTGDVFYFGSPTPAVFKQGLTIKNLLFRSNTTMTSDAGVHIQNMVDVSLTNVIVDGTGFGTQKFWDGMWIDTDGPVVWTGFGAQAQHDAVVTSGTAANAANDIYFNCGKIAKGAVGLHIAGASSLIFGCGDIIANDTNVLIDTAKVATRNYQIVFGSQSFVDTSKVGPGIELNDTLGVTLNSMLLMHGSWIASSHTHGLKIDTGVAYTVSLDDTQLNSNKTDGVNNASTTAIVQIHNSYIANNLGRGLNNTVTNANFTAWGNYYVSNAAGDLGVVHGSTMKAGGIVQLGLMQTALDGGTAPTCVFTSGGGTTPSCTFGGGSTPNVMTIAATTGTGAPTATGVVTVTFNQSFTTNNPVCNPTLSNLGAGQWDAQATVKTATTLSPTVWAIAFSNNAVALSTSTQYQINGLCMGK